MSDSPSLGFGKFVPGFDFLQGLAKSTSQGLPNLSNWVAPTLSVEELDKRISELKAVHFWLDQNSKALGATIQALEVQKMTLATLKGMNLAMGDLASAMKLTPESMGMPAAKTAASANRTSAKPAPESAPPTGDAKSGATPRAAANAPAATVVDPLQWWGALTQQFQAIAGDALKDVARQAGNAGPAASMTGAAQDAMKAASGMAEAMTAAGRKGAPAAKKAAARKRPARSR